MPCARSAFRFRSTWSTASSCRAIESFDQFVVLLKNTVSQMVYKHAISTIVPARSVRISDGDGDDAQPAGV